MSSYFLLKRRQFPNFFSEFFGMKGEYYFLGVHLTRKTDILCTFPPTYNMT